MASRSARLDEARGASAARASAAARTPEQYSQFSMEELMSYGFTRGVASELIGTMLFLYTTVGTIVFNAEDSTRGAALSNAMAFGFAIYVLVSIMGPIGGGHLNPAVTVGLFLYGKVTVMKSLAYIGAQLVGAIVGVLLVDLTAASYNKDLERVFDRHIYVNGVKESHSFAALIGEVVMTFLLVFTVMTVVDPKRSKNVPHVSNLAPLAIGMAVFLGHLVLIPIDNCSINPARSFGAAIIAGEWQSHWVFWAGPMGGAVLASLLYRFFFAAPSATGPSMPTVRANSLRAVLRDNEGGPKEGAEWTGAAAPHDD